MIEKLYIRDRFIDLITICDFQCTSPQTNANGSAESFNACQENSKRQAAEFPLNCFIVALQSSTATLAKIALTKAFHVIYHVKNWGAAAPACFGFAFQWPLQSFAILIISDCIVATQLFGEQDN